MRAILMIQRISLLRRVAVKRKRSNPRRGPLRSAAYRRWLNDRPCVACLKLQKLPMPAFSHAAHTANNGMRSKGPDSSCAPLCGDPCTPDHHGEYDGRKRLPDGEYGRRAFEAFYGVDMEREAANHWAVFQLTEGM